MLIDSTQFMYDAFQACRHTLHPTGQLLTQLTEILEMVKQQGKLTIESPDDWANSADESGSARRTPSPTHNVENQLGDELTPENHLLFSLLDIGASDLQRLWTADAKLAVRSLGYAFHIIPALLRAPEQFDPKGYMFCFRIVSSYWSQYSPELQQAFCKVVGLDLREAEALINSPEFPIKMWRNLSE